jgi:hypothetical protein
LRGPGNPKGWWQDDTAGVTIRTHREDALGKLMDFVDGYGCVCADTEKPESMVIEDELVGRRLSSVYEKVWGEIDVG